MARKQAFSLQFDGWEEMMSNLDRISHEGAVEGAKKALKVSHDIVTPKLEVEMQKHRRTGRTEEAIIRDERIKELDLNVYGIDVGFDLYNGGMASIFLMYGTPYTEPDKDLYDAIYGSKVKKEIAKAQEKIIKETIAKYMEG